MKKVFLILTIVTLLVPIAKAQTKHKGENFLLFERTYDFSPGGNYHFFRNSNTQSFSLLITKAINKEAAWRFGIGFKDHNHNYNLAPVFQNDTTYQTTVFRQTPLIHLIAGKEWRKYLHKDVSIIGGLDLVLGGGPAEETEQEAIFYQDNFILSRASIQNNGFGLYGSVTPFTGIRINWKCLMVGYNITAPIQTVYTFSDNLNTGDFDISLGQSLSIGYRFNSKKSIKN